ncbi:MAG: hypothetical protein ACKO0V_13850 [bacterium]
MPLIRHLPPWAALIVVAVAIGLSIDFQAPPRFDETGYAILGLSLAQGQGYREIDKPDRPVHAHFPPGWPAALAATWSVVSPKACPPTRSAHALVLAISAGSLLVWGLWLYRVSGPLSATALAIALASNWFWIRMAGELRSESLFILLSSLVFLLETESAEHRTTPRDILSGLLIGLAILTRQAAVALLAAVLLNDLLGHRRKSALTKGFTAICTILPWVVWVATSGRPAQASLLANDELSRSLARRLADQSLFYLIRLPDSLFGPFLESATIFRTSPPLKWLAWLLAALFFLVFSTGLVRLARLPHTRLAAVYLVVSLAMLIAWPFTEAGRFLIPLVPLVLLAFTSGLVVLASRLKFSPFLKNTQAERLAPWLVAALCLPIGLYTWQKQVRGDAQGQDSDFNQACAWVAQNTAPGAIIASRHPGDLYWRSGRAGLVWPESGEIDAAHRALLSQNAAYLLIDSSRYAKAAIPAWCSPGPMALRPELFREIAPAGWSPQAVRLYEVHRP